MLAAPPTRIVWRRSGSRTRQVIAAKQLMSASRSGAAMVVLVGMFPR